MLNAFVTETITDKTVFAELALLVLTLTLYRHLVKAISFVVTMNNLLMETVLAELDSTELMESVPNVDSTNTLILSLRHADAIWVTI